MLDLLDLLLGPAQWRKLSGPAALAAAVAFGLIGLLFAAVGCLLLAQNGSRVVALMVLCPGLAVVVDVAVGVIAFLRANSGPR
jgi:hypothetical protein